MRLIPYPIKPIAREHRSAFVTSGERSNCLSGQLVQALAASGSLIRRQRTISLPRLEGIDILEEQVEKLKCESTLKSVAALRRKPNLLATAISRCV